MLSVVASIMFGVVGLAAGGTTGLVIGVVVPILFGFQRRRLRGRR